MLVWAWERASLSARMANIVEDLLAIRTAIRGSPEEIGKFYMADQAMISREEFFNPDNLQPL